jgi:hypothetical protein
MTDTRDETARRHDAMELHGPKTINILTERNTARKHKREVDAANAAIAKKQKTETQLLSTANFLNSQNNALFNRSAGLQSNCPC